MNSKKKPISALLLALCLLQYSLVSLADGCSEYIFYEEGRDAIVLTASHGAAKNKLLPGVALRKGGDFKGFVTRSDQYTDVLTWRIAALLKQKGLAPFVVVAGIHRSQVDFNRSAEEAYESSLAGECYRAYHNKVSEAVSHIKQHWGNGFLLDVHGQSRYKDDIIRGTRNSKTIRRLVGHYNSDVTEADDGFFYFLRGEGYKVSPEKNKKERYFYGGYTVQRYGSHQPEGLDAIQLELARSLRVNEGKREVLAHAIAEAIARFYRRYYANVKWSE